MARFNRIVAMSVVEFHSLSIRDLGGCEVYYNSKVSSPAKHAFIVAFYVRLLLFWIFLVGVPLPSRLV